jgi:hypothetical protein
MRQFRAPFRGSGNYVYDPRPVHERYRVPVANEFRSEILASQFGLAAEIAVDCLVHMRDQDVVLVARRRDMLDLVTQVGFPFGSVREGRI